MIIHSITGTLTEKQLSGFVCCKVNDIEWLLAMSEQSINLLPTIGSQVRIYTQLKVSENSIAIYGFATREERSLFEALISVSGIGPKVALSMLSKANSVEISACIIRGDVKTLSKLPGIGNKTAQKLILQLSDKLEKLLLLSNSEVSQASSSAGKAEGSLQQLLGQRREYSELRTALVDMGYDDKNCTEVLNELFRQWQDNAEEQGTLPPEGERLRQAILRLST